MASAMKVDVQGFCKPGFEGVREAFAANFEAGLEVGASFAATVDGEFVVDIWAGNEGPGDSRPWRRDTLMNVFSTTKAMTAICLHMLADRGLVDFNAKVADYWPEFAQNGKAGITVAQLVSHQGGLSSVTKPLPGTAFYDWETMIHALEEETPWWEPGTANGYHAITFGYLAGELIRRVSGRSVGTFFREEVAEPLNADFHIGFGPALDQRVGQMIPAPVAGGVELPPDSILMKVMMNPMLDLAACNTREWRACEIPAANGHGNARSCARIMSAMALGGEVDGVRLMSRAAIERATTEQCYRPDLVLGIPMRWGLGFMLASKDLQLGPNGGAFGHGGAGGSLAIADPEARASWGYVMNRMDASTTGDARARDIAAALYRAI